MAIFVKPKKVEMELSKLEAFDNPILTYEQYVTPPHIVANMLTYIEHTHGDIRSKNLLDLGCGTGMLTLGAALMGAGHCTGVDICSKALIIAEANKKLLTLSNVDFIQCDIKYMRFSMNGKATFDTVIMNPPFGTKGNVGIDVLFLDTAFQLNAASIYSLHKRATRKHILKQGIEYSYQADVIAELKFNIDYSFSFHKMSTTDVEVDLFRFKYKTS